MSDTKIVLRVGFASGDRYSRVSVEEDRNLGYVIKTGTNYDATSYILGRSGSGDTGQVDSLIKSLQAVRYQIVHGEPSPEVQRIFEEAQRAFFEQGVSWDRYYDADERGDEEEAGKHMDEALVFNTIFEECKEKLEDFGYMIEKVRSNK